MNKQRQTAKQGLHCPGGKRGQLFAFQDLSSESALLMQHHDHQEHTTCHGCYSVTASKLYAQGCTARSWAGVAARAHPQEPRCAQGFQMEYGVSETDADAASAPDTGGPSATGCAENSLRGKVRLFSPVGCLEPPWHTSTRFHPTRYSINRHVCTRQPIQIVRRFCPSPGQEGASAHPRTKPIRLHSLICRTWRRRRFQWRR